MLKEFKFSTFISEKNHIYFKMNMQYMVWYNWNQIITTFLFVILGAP